MASIVAAWPSVALDEVLTQDTQYIDSPELRIYPKLSVKLYGKGVVLDAPADGATLKMQRHQIAHAGQVILSEIWGKKGAIGIVPPEGEGALCTSHFFLFDIRRDRLDPKWLQAIFTANYLQDQLDNEARGTTGYAAVRPKHLLSATIPLPPLDDQRRIVARIEALAARIEQARGLRREALAEAEALFYARLGALVGDPYQGVVGTLGLKRFVRIGDIAIDVADGPHVTPQYVDEGVPFITVLNITSGHVDFRGAKFITSAAHEEYCRRAKAEPGDVLVSKDGTIGIPCVVDTDTEFSFFVSVALIKPMRTEMDGNFLAWMFRCPYLQDRIRLRSRGDMIRHLVLREIKELQVPLPTLDEQRRLARCFSDMKRTLDDLRNLQAETQDELDALLPSILDKAFRGEL